MRRSSAAAERNLSRTVLIGVAGLLFAAACGSTSAQDYPSKPIRILVGFSAGSTTDILARTVAQKMNEAWGQPVLVDNRPSAGAIVASGVVAAAAPDGYTLLMVSAGHAATAAMSTKLPYDTLKDFAGVSRLANVPSILVNRDGKLLALAATTERRSAILPDVPTIAEAGVSGYAFDPWFGILAPAKTPPALLAKLSTEIARILELPDVRERLRALGADPAPTTPEGFDAHVRAEIAKFDKIVRDAGIKPE